MTQTEYKEALRQLSPAQFDLWLGRREAYLNLAWEIQTRTDELEDELFQRYLEYLHNPDPNPIFTGLELIFVGYEDEQNIPNR